MNSGDRSFTVDAFYKSGRRLSGNVGRYISETPARAAQKAFSQYYQSHPKIGRTLEIHIRETTSGSKHKIFKYIVSKVKTDVSVVRDGVTIQYKYKTKVRAI